MADKMSVIDWIAYVLVIIGALNWGLYGIGGFLGSPWDLVKMLLGSIPILQNLVYLLVGLSGIWVIYSLTKK